MPGTLSLLRPPGLDKVSAAVVYIVLTMKLKSLKVSSISDISFSEVS